MRRLLAVLGSVGFGVLTACGGDDGAGGDARAEVVVTFPVLGAVVEDVVGDAATVRVLMPNGTDPHDWEPSARDVEAVQEAALVVTNGLELEAGLEGALDEAAGAGVPVFAAADHVTLREIGEGELAEEHEGEDHEGEDHEGEDHEGEDHEGEEHDHEHGVGSDDPHLWMDPVAMAAVAEALGPALAGAGIDVGDRAATVAADLRALDAEVASALAPVPEERRQLVSGHESLGYFADRYGFTVVGAVVPSLTTQAEASAGEIAELVEAIEAAGVEAIFVEEGTPDGVAESIADEAGVEVVELATHRLPDDGTYRTFVLDLANTIAAALAA